ncbi:MAG TPA: hypothetical protein VJM31_07315 [Vicinamibacterales bacterium]|nr:hypothetical protein [Vicinamibacterales bacterium]
MDPDYNNLIARATVEELAKLPEDDKLGIWAREMLRATDEEAVFLRGARVFVNNYGRNKRRAALALLAMTFDADPAALKRYLRFKGLVNEKD